MGEGAGEARTVTPFITKVEMAYRARAEFLYGKHNRLVRRRCIEAADRLAQLQLTDDLKEHQRGLVA